MTAQGTNAAPVPANYGTVGSDLLISTFPSRFPMHMNAVSSLQNAVHNLPSMSISSNFFLPLQISPAVLPDVPPAPPSTPIDSSTPWPSSLPTSGESDHPTDPLLIPALNECIDGPEGKLQEAIPFHNTGYQRWAHLMNITEANQAVSEAGAPVQPSAASQYERYFDAVPNHHPPGFHVNELYRRLQTLAVISTSTQDFHDHTSYPDIELAHGMLGGPLAQFDRQIAIGIRRNDRLRSLVEADKLAMASLEYLIEYMQEQQF
jgi:hypothetical protein